MKSVMQHNFSRVPDAEIPRSQFNRSHGYKTTFDGGYLVPVFVDEALPGDTFNLRMAAFARLATPKAPIMDNIYLDSFFFAVPIRLIWDNWERFNGAQDDPDDPTDYLVPQLPAPAGGFAIGSLFDYFGVPTGIESFNLNALHSRAYNLIYNEWFRDQNLQDSVVVDTDDGPDDDADYVLLKRGKRHDYFTSSLPWPQKGDSVSLPLGTTAPVKNETAIGGAGVLVSNNSVVDDPVYAVGAGAPRDFFADLSDATAATINQLRQAFQIQKMYERDARGGTRYTELIKSHFGVTSPDARLQRPEYLGGGSTPVLFHPVPQTSETTEAAPQGNLSAYATASIRNHGFTKSFTEHCVIIGLICARADLTYQQGLNRMFSRQTRFDFYWPALSMIGEQSVLNREIYLQADTVLDGSEIVNDQAFGYQERYAEYRYKPSQITGLFRSTAGTPLDFWHLSQEFDSLPLLNSDFIEENPPIDRVIAVTNEPEFLFDSFFDLKCARPMPVYSVPGLIDHF